MATRGRKPKPTALKLVDGSAKVHPERVNADEPIPAGALGDAPGHLSAEARAKWEEVAAMAFWLTEADRDLLADYCRLETDAAKLHAQATEEGATVIGGAGGPILNPTFRAWDMCRKSAARMRSELGLTPTERARLKMPRADDEVPGAELVR